jgi:hypothetical protein
MPVSEGFAMSIKLAQRLTFSLVCSVVPPPDNYEYAVWCSFVEVYNENVHDLLSSETKSKNLSLKQDHKHSDNKFVAGATTVRVWSEAVSNLDTSPDREPILTERNL